MTEERRLRAAFLCSGDPLSVRTWSGSPNHMLRALQERFAITQVIRRPFPRWFPFVRRLARFLSGGRRDIYWSPFWSSVATRATRRRLLADDCDIVIAAGASPVCAHFVQQKPTIFISDATFAAMQEYNPGFSRLNKRAKEAGASLETKAIENSIAALFPSEWAASSAKAHHHAAPDSTFVIPWGANFQPCQKVAPEERDPTCWRLLLVGVDWVGKGGDIAVQALNILRDRGFSVTLDIVGCAPSAPPPTIEGVEFHGFLSKNNPEQLARLHELYARSHLFVLPTQFEALAVVFAEAAAYGLPSVTYRTGGVATNVLHNVTGLMLPEKSPPEAFADAIEGILTQPRRYRRMCNNAIRYSREKLNWAAWAESAEEIARRAHRMVQKAPAPPGRVSARRFEPGPALLRAEA